MREDHPAAHGEKKASSKGKSFSSIQGRLVSLLLLVLVPILLVQAYFSYDQYQSTKRVESEANLHLARATARAFDTFVQDVLHQELAIGLAFTSSQTLSEKEKNRILFDNQAGNPAIWHLFWDNPAGIVTAATGSQFIGMDISDREFYREIVAGKEWVVSDLLLSKTTKQPSFTISRGIRNERGELLGIIVAAILPAKLDRVLAVERTGDAGVSLLDSKGMNAYRYPATQFTWEQRNWLKLYPIIGEVLKGKEVVTNLVSDQTGTNRIGAFTPIPSIGWIATCSRAEEEVVRPIISTTLQETGITLLVAFVSLLTAVALSRTISTSVIILRNYARSLGQGETQNRLTISRPAEIKDLAEAFNKMAEEIRSREKDLRESEALYRSIGESIDYGVWVCAADGRNTYASKSFLDMVGITQEQCSNFGWGDVLHPDDAERTIAAWQECVRTGGKWDIEHRFRGVDGQWHHVLARGVPVRNEQGEIISWAGINLDISRLKRAEAALEASAEQFRALADSIPNLAWWANSDGYITWYNRRWYEYTGTTPEQMEGWGWQSVHDPNELPKVLERWQASITTGEPFEMTFPLRGADGVFRLFLTRVLPLKDSAGRVLQWFGTNTDVSEVEQRVADRTKELAASINHLQSEIRERELAEIKLLEETAVRLQATETLREKERMLILQSRQAAMGEMIGNISHQWRQPLNILGMQIQQLQLFYDMGQFNKELLEKNVSGSMEIIKHMSKTIDDFRNYFRPENEKSEFKVQEAINASLSLLEGSLKNPLIEVEVIAKDDPVLYGFPNEFVQVIINIIHNARDVFIERNVSNPKVIVEIGREDSCAVVTVADNAGGISDEIINKVFDPYFTTKGPQQGTGVGLFMSKAIIEKNMCGLITVRNSADGAEFKIEVPNGTHT